MSYSTAGAQKFTMIDDLPDLDDIETPGPSPYHSGARSSQIRGSRYPGASLLPPEQEAKYAKFLRQRNPILRESGMSSRGPSHGPHGPYGAHGPHGPHEPHGFHEPQRGIPTIEESYEKQSDEIKQYAMPDNTPSCLIIAEHIANCPICSKFYNDDRTIYIIAIIVLAVICILLLKKILS